VKAEAADKTAGGDFQQFVAGSVGGDRLVMVDSLVGD
jgi:hypothetical protein